MGITLMPWQRYVLDIACEIDPTTGNFYYREIRLIVPRQQGKTVLLLAKAIHRMLAWPGMRLVYTAQTRNMAKQRLIEDFHEPLAASPLAGMLDHTLGRRDGRPGLRTQAGDEHMAFANKSRFRIDAPTKQSGHGPRLDEGIIDEAFAHNDSRIEVAMKPAMKTRRNAQLWVVSAAGDGDSTYLHQKVDDGRERIENPVPGDRVCYIEWSAPDNADADDPEVWRSCMPAWGITVFEDTIRAERGSMDDDDFRRTNLNQWRDRKSKPGIFPEGKWSATAVEANDDVWVVLRRGSRADRRAPR
jgi:phage terminase large subunit-like protein